MSLFMAEIVLLVLAAYAAMGLLVACAMLAGGLRRLDAAAAAAPWHVQCLFVPGIVALWPLVLRRARGRRPIEDRP
ncbi:hypothetical protein O4H66_23675 [Comamonadaceae bacterium G21597-S1]|nr:hypothetical protein [Comamonadaceae bacterium G21597-S1]